MSDFKSKFCQISVLSTVVLLFAVLSVSAFAIPPLMPSTATEMNATDDDEQLPSPDDFVAVEVMPEMIYESVPIYPDKDRKAGHEGVVWIKALVDKNGNSVQALVAKTSNYENLDNAALDAATKNRFKPAIQNGRPIAVWITYKVEFLISAHEKVEVKKTEPNADSLSKFDVYPKLVFGPEPEYPAKATAAGIEGSVIVKVLVGIDGSVVKVKFDAFDIDPHGFKAAAKKAALTYKFMPAIKSAEPVTAWVEFEVKFKLE